MNNKVSIIIPYYRKKIFILDALKSALNQTYKNFEIIIIYDDLCKIDLVYIKKIVKFDKKITLLINKKNLGAGYSRNKGIKYSKGDYIAFLDADDLWDRKKLFASSSSTIAAILRLCGSKILQTNAFAVVEPGSQS